MSEQICCPHCGNRELQVQTETNVQTSGKGYSASKGCCGYMLLGPLGLLCGSCGQGQKTTTTNTTYWTCPKCGNRFRSPNDLREEISNNKKAQIAVAVLGIVFAIFIMILFFSVEDTGLGIGMGIFTAIFWEIVFYFVFRYKNNKLQTEIEALEADMQRFLGGYGSSGAQSQPYTYTQPQAQQYSPPKPQSQSPQANEWQCPKCGRINQNYVGTCGCGEVKPK